MAAKEDLTSGPAFPWGTVTVTLLAGLCLVSPAVSEALIYNRPLILGGQVWRGWTGHVVHYGLSHFFWDVAVFLPAGWWLERLRPAAARWFYALSPWVMTAVMLALDPALLRYAGLSGLATGVLVFLAVVQLRRGDREPAWIWLGVLALVALKIGLELFTGAPLVVSGFTGIRTVPLAHIGGAACGLIFGLCPWRKPVA